MKVYKNPSTHRIGRHQLSIVKGRHREQIIVNRSVTSRKEEKRHMNLEERTKEGDGGAKAHKD